MSPTTAGFSGSSYRPRMMRPSQRFWMNTRASGRLLYARAREPSVQEHHPYERKRGRAGRKRRLDQRVEAPPSPSYHVEEDRPEIFLSDGGSSSTAAAGAPEPRGGGRAVRLALPQFPDAHKYRGDLPEIGWFSSAGGAWRAPFGLRWRSGRPHPSISPGQQSPDSERLPSAPQPLLKVDENLRISGRSPS